jgi:hypothetical protein
MKKFALTIAALAISAGVAFAQTPAAQPSGQPSAVTTVENWTAKEWNAAKTKWAKEKTKWADCQQQSTDQKLTGRKSWLFLYNCMNT